MILDVSVEGAQTYVEDCEVCCSPIQLTYDATDGKIKNFTIGKAYG